MDPSYIHGFSSEEQARLVAQAEVLAPGVFEGMQLPDQGSLLEIGCAVGAELKLIHQRWPDLQLAGLDLSRNHLVAARSHLAPEIKKGVVTLEEGDAADLPYPNDTFDRVITIWMLEHVPDPKKVIKEALRVLKPQGKLITTEVDNASFRFEPKVEEISRWWDRFNMFQSAGGGDPFIGTRLASLADALGAREVTVEERPMVSSRLEPERRDERSCWTISRCCFCQLRP